MSTIYKIQHHREQGNAIPCKINTPLSPAAKQDVKKKEGSGRAPWQNARNHQDQSQ